MSLWPHQLVPHAYRRTGRADGGGAVITVPWQVAIVELFLAALGNIALASAIGRRIMDYRASRAADRDWWEGPC